MTPQRTFWPILAALARLSPVALAALTHGNAGMESYEIAVPLVSLLVPLLLDQKRIELVAPAVGVVGIAFHLLINQDESFRQLGFRLSTPSVYLRAFLVTGL